MMKKQLVKKGAVVLLGAGFLLGGYLEGITAEGRQGNIDVSFHGWTPAKTKPTHNLRVERKKGLVRWHNYPKPFKRKKVYEVKGKDFIYKVKKGDSLQSIARVMYGTGDQWEKIYQANKELIGEAQEVQAGQQIVIP